MVTVLTLGVLPVQSLAETATQVYPVDHVETVADPQTLGRPGSVYGDETPLFLLFGLLLCSGGALATMLISRKRRTHSR